jgi:predicted transcriptional regulator of viral defense system
MSDTGLDFGRVRGIITTARLRSAGLSADEIRRLVRVGTLVAVRRGVYAPARLVASTAEDQAAGHLLRVAAALAVTSSRSAGSHHSAAAVHGIQLLGRMPDGIVTVTRSPDARGSRSGPQGVLVHAAELPAEHVTVRQGVRITSAARTVIDLARNSSFIEGVAMTDSALHAGKTSKAELEAVLACCRQWRGVQRARRVVAFSDPRAESVLESIARVVFHSRGLPAPDLQVWVGDDDTVIGRVDFLWRKYRTIGEADGAIKYADPLRAAAQLERDARLRDAGYEVVHFSWQQIVRAPAQVVASVRAAFRRAGAA